MFPKKFLSRESFNNLFKSIKLLRCPKCGQTGILILHGYLRGFDEYKTIRNIRARRIFCSNRNKKNGCGKTFSCYLILSMQRTLISTNTAWQFLSAILSGKSLEHAYNCLDPQCLLSIETFFRFWRRFKSACTHIRTFLADHFLLEPAAAASVTIETIKHLADCFDHQFHDPIALYQLNAQQNFV